MVNIRKIYAAEFKKKGISAYLSGISGDSRDVIESVRRIIRDVKDRGDNALIDYTLKYDGVDLRKLGIRVKRSEIDEAYKYADPKLIDALKKAAENIEKFHAAQLRRDWFIEIGPGIKAGQIIRPLESVGVYVPGGRAVYPSTVLMAAVPASVAGVERIAVCSPPSLNIEFGGKKFAGVHPAILIAADIAGVEEIYKIGSAWAVAALAYGTASVKPVDKIVGPGNKYVNAAKISVSNDVLIDTPAGPSEIAIICDDSTDPLYAAYDLISQVEHDPDNVGIIITHSEPVADKIIGLLDDVLEKIDRREIAGRALEKNGLVIITSDINESIEIANLIAPEHLELPINNAREYLKDIKHAGAVFLGPYSPVPLGDYCAGTNHVLPTGGTARRYSGLGTHDFVKFSDVLICERSGLEALYGILKPIAEFEGLTAHRDAVKIRMPPSDGKDLPMS